MGSHRRHQLCTIDHHRIYLSVDRKTWNWKIFVWLASVNFTISNWSLIFSHGRPSHAAVTVAWVESIQLLQWVCVFVCLPVHALKGKWLNLWTPTLTVRLDSSNILPVRSHFQFWHAHFFKMADFSWCLPSWKSGRTGTESVKETAVYYHYGWITTIAQLFWMFAVKALKPHFPQR